MATESRDTYAAMQDGEPLARYKKAIVGKVHVTVLDPFTGEPDGVILSGMPGDMNTIDEQMVELWSAKEERFFERTNKKHINAGRLIKVESVQKPPPSPNVVTDEEIDVLLDGRKTKYLAFKNRLDKFTDTAPVFRILNKARELEKSEKMINSIEKKVSDLQMASYGVVEEETKE